MVNQQRQSNSQVTQPHQAAHHPVPPFSARDDDRSSGALVSVDGQQRGVQKRRLRHPRRQAMPAWQWYGVMLPIFVLPIVILVGMVVFAASFLIFYNGRIYPNVYVMNVNVGGMVPSEAVASLQNGAWQWDTLILRDGDTGWTITPSELGLTLDASSTIQSAYNVGRTQGQWFWGVVSPVAVQPVISFDEAQAREALQSRADLFAVAPTDAGVRVENGCVVAVPAESGRTLLVQETVQKLYDPANLVNGELELAMAPIPPTVVDSGPYIASAEALLTQPMRIRVFDPVTGDSVVWQPSVDLWGSWLRLEQGDSTPYWTIDHGLAAHYIEQQASAVFDASRYLHVDDVVTTIEQAVLGGVPGGYARVFHHDRYHTVLPGESLVSIAWNYGVPYPWLQQANPGLTGVSIGQTLTVPPPDQFFEQPVVPDKRVVVSISQQRVWVYDGDSLRWEWVTSTGIADSPTWPGLYQIISHVPNAYAGNWDLYMPSFLGVYHPIPGSGFTNGFHGFPTRGGSQLLWTNSLGTRVTYGCILLSNENAQLLYNWAENGVVVEITP